MTWRRTIRHLAMLGLVCGVSTPALAQDPLGRAKTLYASAAYDDALTVLSALHPADTSTASEAAAYQVFCLLALGRKDEAKEAVKTLVAADPLYRPSDAEASPRVLAFFDDVRRPLLPDLARQSYTTAKAAFDKKDFETAHDGFGRVLTLIGDLGATADPGMTDLKTLAEGFLALSQAALADARPPADTTILAPIDVTPAALPAAQEIALSAPPPAAPAEPATYSSDDKDVKKPVATNQVLPEWRPANGLEARQEYNGLLDLVIGEDGRVLSAQVIRSVHPRYDPELIKAASAWRFRPATKDGAPVRFHYVLSVHLNARGGR